VRILAETRNRKHSRELFKLLRENYEVRNTIKQPGGLYIHILENTHPSPPTSWEGKRTKA
jgi:hypothetical protein